MGYRCVKIDLAVQETNESLLNSTKPIAHVLHKSFKTVDPATGDLIWKRKSKAGRQLLEWMLDHGFFHSIVQVLDLAVNYNLDRIGKKDEEYQRILSKHMNAALVEIKQKRAG